MGIFDFLFGKSPPTDKRYVVEEYSDDLIELVIEDVDGEFLGKFGDVVIDHVGGGDSSGDI